jgi:acetylcholinesterase
MHQITAISTITGANRHVFKRAILQSPAFFPVGDNINPEKTYDNYLEAAGNAQDLEELRALPPNDARVVRANALTIQAAPYGQFVYGPVVDGYYVTSLPGRLLRDGHWDHDVEIMVGYNSNEGLLFTPPYIQSDAMFEQYIRQVFPEAKDEIISYITDTLYPSPGEGATPREKISRLNEALGAAAVACNTYYLNKAADNGTYSYMFSVYPGLHGQDIPYMVSLNLSPFSPFSSSCPLLSPPSDPSTFPYRALTRP